MLEKAAQKSKERWGLTPPVSPEQIVDYIILQVWSQAFGPLYDDFHPIPNWMRKLHERHALVLKRFDRQIELYAASFRKQLEEEQEELQKRPELKLLPPKELRERLLRKRGRL